MTKLKQSPHRGSKPEMKLARESDAPRLLEAAKLTDLLDLLTQQGFDVVGPTMRDEAVVLDHIHSIDELPVGWTDEQTPGHYRLKRREDRAFFAYTVGAQSWKRHLHPADIQLWSAEREHGTFHILNNGMRPKELLAFLGVRPCELAAMAVQDRVLIGDKYRDTNYAGRRESTFIVAVQCTQSASTCFCASLGTGPRAQSGYDLLLTELIGPEGHFFIVRSGTKRGGQILSQLETVPVTDEIVEHEADALESAAQQQGRKLNTEGLRDFLYSTFDSPRWETISSRCLACANCTMVCPTCFCTTVEDGNDLSGNHAERWRRWDSCFTLSFSYIHGGSVRASCKSRYRQWVTHKLAAWVDQFGMLGCVGCGRCITWCPVGIDLTESVSALREGENNGNP